MKVIFVSVCLLSMTCAFGQDKKVIDSIESRIAYAVGLERASGLYDLVYYYLRVDNAKATIYFNQLKTYRDDEPADVLSYVYMARGIFFNRNGKLDSAILLLEKSRAFSEKSGQHRALLRANASLAHTFISSGKAEKGLDYLFQSLRILNEHPDKEMEMKLRTNIPWAYLELKQYRNCITFGLQNLAMMEGTPFEWIALYNYNNIAVSYGALGKLDSARFFIAKGIAAAEKNNDNQSLANGYFILGTIYATAGEPRLAIDQYLKARPFREKVGNPFFLVSDLYTISDLYYNTGEFANGVKAGLEALALAQKFDLDLKLESTYFALAKNYEGLKDFKNASKYYRLYAVAKDSVYQNASSQAIAEMQTKYETEKKEKQLAIQKAELLEQQAQIQETNFVIAALAISIVLLCIIFLLLRSRALRKSEIREKQQELFYREGQIQASIQSQETERKRFAQDLHDGMGQLISALRIALQGVRKETPIEERHAIVSKSEGILNEMHHEIRSIAFNLMPQTLLQHGLVLALKEMSDRVNDTGQVILRVTSFDFPARLSEIEEIALYRIVQEWVNNVMKYGKANLIQVQLIGHEEELNITIEDDGAGFDPGVLYNGVGNGWKNINSRLNLIRGSIHVDSTPGMGGTTVMIRVNRTNPGIVKEQNEIQALDPDVAPTVAPNTH